MRDASIMEPSKSKIVRISDFCNTSSSNSRYSHRRRRPGRKSQESSGLTSDAYSSRPPKQSRSMDDEEQDHYGTLVLVSILKSLPAFQYDDENDKLFNGHFDEYSTIYTESVELLLQLRVFDGQLCMISGSNGEKNSENDKGVHLNAVERERQQWVPVRIKVLPPGIFTSNDDSKPKKESNSQRHARLHSLESVSRIRIYIPPTLAATIGLNDFDCLSLELQARLSRLCIVGNLNGTPTAKSKLMNDLDADLSSRLQLPTATKAKIMEISPPPHDHMPSPEAMFRQMGKDQVSIRRYKENQKQKQIDRLQQYFYRSVGTRDIKKDATPRLSTVGSIFAVVDDDEKARECFEGNLRSSIRFYTILEMETEKGVIQKCTCAVDISNAVDHFCWISPKTQLILVPREDSQIDDRRISRIPQLSLTWIFHQSIQRQSDPCAKTFPDFMRKVRSHPSLADITGTLVSMGSLGMIESRSYMSSGLPLNTQFLSLIGSEENHIKDCLDAAADSVGMNIIHIDGLASFAFRYKSLQVEDRRGSTVGTIADKTAGIQAAFAVARKCLPCIIHVCLDEEISDAGDTEIRHDEENRLMSCFKEEMKNIYDENIANDIPLVLVMISTQKELLPGPISTCIIHDSVHITNPNEAYTKSLWGDVDTFNGARETLLGRSAEEIRMIGSNFRRIKNEALYTHQATCDFPEQNFLEQALDCFDKNHTTISNSSNTLSSDLIPDIKWEDIGGLSHVRDEIIDVIELPLTHPELFKGSRRSGILFFGPPGSGKTLVAKAVASECGLPFLSVKGPELLGSYVGESESNIRNAFASAREAAASSNKDSGKAAILFFDEIDSLAPRRGELGDGGGVMERVVSTLLGELDRDMLAEDSTDDCHVFVIAATNRPDLLDPSLLRPGRFDRMVYLGLASEREDRIQILAAQTRKFKFEGNVDAVTIASEVIDDIPESLSGADFSGIASGALMLALQRVCDDIDEGAHSSGSSTEDTISKWPEDRLIPRVRAEDFIAAAARVNPSVNEDDLHRYETMQREYCAVHRN